MIYVCDHLIILCLNDYLVMTYPCRYEYPIQKTGGICLALTDSINTQHNDPGWHTTLPSLSRGL